MPMHIDLKRLTRLKVDKMDDAELKKLGQELKAAEAASAELATAVRDGKVISKKLDEARKSTDGKKKDKDKASGYEKEGKLVDEMNSKLAEIHADSGKVTKAMDAVYNSAALKDNPDATKGGKVLQDRYTRKPQA